MPIRQRTDLPDGRRIEAGRSEGVIVLIIKQIEVEKKTEVEP